MIHRLRIAAAVAAAVALLAVPTAGAKSHHYPKSVTKAFLASCTKSAKKLSKSQAKTYCGTALTCIERKLSLKQFEKAAKDIDAGANTSRTKSITSCEKAAAKKIGG